MHRILLIDDDAQLGAPLATYFQRFELELVHALRPSDGLAQLTAGGFDAAILDVMLPEMDGFEVCRTIRKQGDLPIVMLTARGEVMDRVVGLELGADDYLVKPFAFAELLARVRSLLRRGGPRQDIDRLTAADLDMDLLRRRVTRAGRRLDLTGKEFALLELLLRRQGEVLPRSLIASQVWDMNFDSDTNVIDVAIRRLRAKVDEDFPRKLIRTVRGMGYVLDPEGEEGPDVPS